MNTTKWTEIFKAFYCGVECSSDAMLSKIQIPWTTKTTDGYIYSDSTWTHFASSIDSFKDIVWLKIGLTPENRQIVLDTLRQIHVPGEIFEDAVIVYGYRTDVDYI